MDNDNYDDPKINKIEERNQPFIYVLSSLLFGRFGLNHGCGVCQCGEFSENFLKDWGEYRKASDAWCAGDANAFKKVNREPGFCSPGLGYCPDTLASMRAAGFYTGPAVALYLDNYGPVWGKDISPEEALIRHPLADIQKYFQDLGISCFVGQGGHFPDKLNDAALIFDVNDPGILQKLKPDFLEYFVPQRAKMLCDPNHMNSTELRRGYVVAVAKKLMAYGHEIGAIYQDTKDSSHETLPVINEEIPQRAQAQADYQMEWVIKPFDGMLPVLTKEERGDIIMRLAGALSGLMYKTTPSLTQIQLNSP